MNQIPVAVIDDHPVSRRGMAEFIEDFDRYKVILEASNGQDLQRKLQSATILPDICVVDISMPIMDGYETASWLRLHHPDIKTLAMSMYNHEQVIIRILRHGARGFIEKKADAMQMKLALDSLVRDGWFFPKTLSGKLINAIVHGKSIEKELTPEELSFISLACSELSYADIAVRMQKSKATIDRIRQNVFSKLGIHHRAGLVVFAMMLGIYIEES